MMLRSNSKVVLNIVVSIFTQLVILVIGLVVPRIILVNYGSDVNGLTSTIAQIFTYMALLESGISTAARNKLFKPIKENNKEEISYWVSVSKHYYGRISIIYLIAVFVMALAIPFILKTNVSWWTIALYVLFEGLTSVISFYFINTWTCFLTASGKSYITNSVALLTKILMYSVKIVLALYSVNIALIQAGYFCVSLIQLLIYYSYMKRKYGWMNYKAAPKDVKLPDRNSYIITELAWTIFSSTDLIVLSVFVSTSLSSVYSVYSMIFVALNGLLNAVFCSLNYNLGQAYAHDIEKYKRMHSLFNSVFIGAMTILMSVAYVLIVPFVKLYTAGVTDIEYIYPLLPLLFCMVQMLSWSRYVSGNLTGIAGYAKQTSYISIVEAIINLIASIVLVQFFDITGVLFATVIALPVKVIWCNWLAEHKILKRSPVKTICIIGINWLVFIATVVASIFVEIEINSYLEFFLYGILLTLGYLIVVVILNCLVNKDVLNLKSFLKRG